jgi:hypothetical protein
MIRRLLCFLGLHGPEFYGSWYGMTGRSFERECPHCKARWIGREVVRRDGIGNDYMDTGDWRRVK